MPRSPKYLRGQKSFLPDDSPEEKPNEPSGKKEPRFFKPFKKTGAHKPAGPEPSEHQKAIYRFIKECDDNLAVSAVAGCLSGDTVIEINRAGKSYRDTIAHLVHMLNGGVSSGRIFDVSIPTRVRAYDDETGLIKLMEVESGCFSGGKKVYELRTKTKKIKATADHRFLTDNGWKRLRTLRIGDKVIVDAGKSSEGPKKKAHYDRIVGMGHHPYHHSSKPHKCCWIHRLVVEASLSKIPYEDFVDRIRRGDITGLVFLDPKDWHVHHRDGDHKNNRLRNLQALPKIDHLSLHAREDGWKNVQASARTEEITGLREVGVEDTYDLTMSDEANPNFLANGIVVHNSGKTTTLVGCAKRLRKRRETVVAVAFNTDIAKELQERVASNAIAKTLHSLGYQCCRQIFSGIEFNPRSNSPHFDRIKSLVEGGEIHNPAGWHYYATTQAILNLVDQIRNGLAIESPAFTNAGKLIPPEMIEDAHRYVANWNLELVRIRDAQETLSIDYTDMVYAPAIMLQDGDNPHPDCVFLVDEAQDLNPYQLLLLQKMKPKRIGFFGDPNQSIYAWRGAMSSAWEECITAFSCTELPLSISWRCCTAVVDLAKKYVPRIEASPTAPTGAYEEGNVEKMIAEAKPEDLIVCRNNAPIIKLCVADMLEGRQSRVIGKDIKGMLLAIAKNIVGKDLDSTIANTFLKIEEITIKNPNSYMVDLFEAMRAILGAVEMKLDDLIADNPNYPEPSTAKEILSLIAVELDYLFREETKNCITYRTLHKAKGKEAEVVWHYLPNLLPSKFAKTDDQIQQEDNLAYVGITRAKTKLIHVF